jgi:hypothetical protein
VLVYMLNGERAMLCRAAVPSCRAKLPCRMFTHTSFCRLSIKLLTVLFPFSHAADDAN